MIGSRTAFGAVWRRLIPARTRSNFGVSANGLHALELYEGAERQINKYGQCWVKLIEPARPRIG